MVNFSVFNELSLPLKQYQAKDSFGVLFELLKKLKYYGITTIRMSDNFKNYSILENITFYQFFKQQSDKDFKTRLSSFISNTVFKIDSPIIKETDTEQLETIKSSEYFYKGTKIEGGLACCDIWNTLAVSFNSNNEWNTHSITIQKDTMLSNADIKTDNVCIKHASQIKHLESHSNFFDCFKKKIKLNITRENFWQKRTETFPNIIIFCQEVEKQIQKLDKDVFNIAISLLIDVEAKKKITDSSYSSESQTVTNNPKFRKKRMFTINNEKVLFENHIKSLTSGHRIYFLEKDNYVYIGYIGKHLSTAKY